ncbi:DegT/DnrJ/EryC1/StrS family aminotransferase [Candidatus Saccharibacteria bacterium]|nr:DegT/DnrJ/EryC1/StrS family aminotransferase [Candidatus Saccharibacteria bacterium]
MNDESISNVQAVIEEYEGYLNLTANENSMSLTAKKYLSTVISDRYYFEGDNEGYSDFPEFVASGNHAFDTLINETKQTLNELFKAEYTNLNPLSGIHAMLIVLLSYTQSGDAVASLSPQAHGHFSTATVIERIGRKSVLLPVNEDGDIDTNALAEFIDSHDPKMIYIDAMSYQHAFDIQSIRDIVGKQMIIVFDASHTLGLIAGGVFPNPFDYGADIICGNTHKTFPGPHRGVVLAKNQDLGLVLDEKGSNLYSTVQGGTLASLAVTVSEMKVYIHEYASSIVKNAQSLQTYLVREGLIPAYIPLTNNHQVHILKPNRTAAVEFLKKLKTQGILAHMCYGYTEGFYVRVGTQEITRRGMSEPEMEKIAVLLRRVNDGEECKSEVVELNKWFNTIHYSFDRESDLV